MSEDPTRRAPGSWPRDRPIRWVGVARNLSWFVVATGSLLVQLSLVIWLLVVDLPVRPILALGWGVGTLAAAWAWVTGRWWIVVPPIVSLAVLWLVATIGG